jgi:asparaginyl-tRNA synthetase
LPLGRELRLTVAASTPTPARDLAANLGGEAAVAGWVVTARPSGSILFLEVRDGTGTVQAVASKADLPTEAWDSLSAVTTESSVELVGAVAPHPKRPGECELHVSGGRVIGRAAEWPLGKKEHGPDFLLDSRHLWIRAPRQRAILRVRDQITRSIQAFLHEHGFTRFDSPIFTPNACEGTTTLFEVNYFDWAKAYLSQSGQLYLEAAIASLGRVYDFGPVFRAEKSKTRRHLTEFWMVDAEAAFVEHDENVKLQEQLICRIVSDALASCQAEMQTLGRDVAKLRAVQPPFPRLTHAEAVAKLRQLGSGIGDGDDLGAEDETKLTAQYDRPVFVERYPAAVKAFYMKRDPADPTRVLCDDLLASEGYGEIIGGSQREDDLAALEARLDEHRLPRQAFEWYLDTRRYGSVPHSGFGLGLERTVAWVCGLDHVRETIPFPRLINRLSP